jgi:hypothetical protein
VKTCWDDGTKCTDLPASDANGRILVFDKIRKTRIAPHPDYKFFGASDITTYLIVKRNKISSSYDYSIEEIMALNSPMN